MAGNSTPFIPKTDADGNGTLDYREFVAALLHMQSIDNDKYLRKAFLYFDKDGSGYIEIEEFREALADDFGPNNIDVVNNIFNEVDADKMEIMKGDNQVSKGISSIVKESK